MLLGTFRVGEDITIAIDIMEGDPSAVVGISASMRRLLTITGPEFDPSFAAVAVTVVARAAAGEIPAGWNLTVPASITAALAPGNYGIDARLVGAGGSVDITDTTAVISLVRAAIA